MTIKRIAKWYVSILKMNMTEQASLSFRLRKINERRNYRLDEINRNDLMSEKTCKHLCWTLAYISINSYWLCFNFAFAELVAISVGITSSAAGMKICAITAEIKKYKTIIKKKKKHDKIVLIGKAKLNTIEVLVSKALINSYISHDKFVSVKNVLRENPETSVECII